MFSIQRIRFSDQKIILEKKLDERLKFALLTSDQHPDALTNRTVFTQLCKDDWKFFVNNAVFLEDPEAISLDEKKIPFLLWDYQEQAGDEIVKAIINGYDLPIEKCRKLGITWLVLVIALWGWQFQEWDVLIGSRKAEEVDKRGDMGALFEKLRYMITNQPEWLFGTRLDNFNDKAMLLKHPGHGATIAGEGNNANFGRSDRRKVAFLDEFTSWEQTDRSAWQGLSATTKCRLPVSTPNTRGINCYFYSIVKSAKKKHMPILTLRWWLNPVFSRGLRLTTPDDQAFRFQEKYTSPWLEDEIRRSTDDQSVAQEILINYEASMTGKVFGKFNAEKQVLDGIAYNEDLPLFISWDFGLDQTAILWIQYDPQQKLFYIIDEYVNDGSSQEGSEIYHYIEVIEAKPYKKALHFGDPHSGNNRSITSGQSPATILRKAGIVFRSQRTPIVNRVTAARNILSQVRIAPRCVLATEMFSSWQLAKSGLPDHSEYSHIGESFTYFAWNFKNRSPKKKSEGRTSRKVVPTTGGVTT